MKKPHIQVDAFPIVDDHFSGVGHYTLGIIQGLDELAGEGKLTYSLITPRRWADRVHKHDLSSYKKIIRNPIPHRVLMGILYKGWRVPVDWILGRGAYYFPSFLAWPTSNRNAGVVLHDVSFLAVPECVSEGNRRFLAHVAPHSIQNAKSIITISEFSKSEIIKYYNVDPSRISVALPSVDKTLFYKRSEREIHSIKAKYDIFSDKYIFSVGNVEPRKNYVRLIEAYMGLPKKVTDEYPLVIVGAGSWNNEEILAKIQDAKEKGYRIINPKQFVKDEDMPALYTGAHFYVFTPIYEGFGMSPVEAYACGTPVVASDIASVPEAAGKAALYIDPYSTESIREGMIKMFDTLKNDPDHFDKAIRKHLQSLTWRESAEITASALTGLPIEYFKKEPQE